MTLLQDAYDVPVISIGLGPQGKRAAGTRRPVEVRLEIDGDIALDTTVTLADIGMPATLEEAASRTGVYGAKLPEPLIARLADELRRRRRGEPAWLLLAPPWAHLPCVAWENVLQPGLGVPVLRLPTSAVTPVASKTPLEIALCVPDAPEGLEYDAGALLERLIRCTRDAVPASTHLQIFAGPRGRRTAERLPAGEFTVHEPTHAATVPPPEPPPGTAIERGIPGRIDNPWLRWILSTLGDRSVDMIHFATPGFLSATYGALDFGDSPLGLTDERCSRLVTAGELIAMVTRTGAWSLGFTIPQRTGWPAGIRLLAHHIGRLMSGPLIVDAPHYAPTDAPDALQQAYSLLFAPPPVAVPSTPSVTIYVNPGRVREAQGTALAPAEGLFEQQIHDRVGALTLGADATDQTLGGAEEPPAWVAANQRTLERWATVILESEAAGTHREAVVQGLNDALEQVSSILAKYADKPEPPR